MKRLITFILAIVILFNLLIVVGDNIVNAVEPDIIWLDKNYDWIDGNLINGMGGFNEGMAPVGLNNKMGYIDKKGNEVISLKYDWASRFKEGLAKVAIDGKFGFINKFGEEVISLQYESIGDFNEGLAWVSKNGKYSYVDKKGKEVISFKYDWANDFSEGLAVVGKGDRYGYIDKKGKEVIPLKYEGANTFSEGLGEIKINNHIGFIDKNDKLIIPAIYTSWYDSQPGWGADYMEGIAGYEQDEIMIAGAREGTRFKEGLAMVGVEGKYGYIDKNNNFIIPPIYYDASEFKEGLAKVDNEDYNYGYIDKKGKQVVIPRFNSEFEFSEGLSLVRDNLYGYIDKTGKEIIPLKYESGTNFNDGVALIKQNNKWGIIKNPFKTNISSLLDNKSKASDSQYTGYKKAYYDYLKEFIVNKSKIEGIEIRGQFAILLDLNGDGIPELITYLWGQYEGHYETHNYLEIFTYNNSKVEKIHELDFYKGGKHNEYGNLYQHKDTGEFYTIYVEHQGGGGNDYTESIDIFKLDDKKFKEYKKYNFGDHYGYNEHGEFREYTVNNAIVDEGVFYKKQSEYQDYLDNLIEIIPEDRNFEFLTDEKIRKILDSFIDEPIEIAYYSNEILSIIGSKKLLNLKLSEKDADLIYEIDDSEIAEVTLGGEIIGLKEGETTIKVKATKLGFQDGEVVIPIRVKPRLKIDFTRIDSSSDNDIDYLKEVLETSDSIYFEDSDTLTELSKLINFTIKKGSRNTIKASKNIISVNEKSFKRSIKDAKRIEKTIEDLLNKEKIKLNREMDRTIRLDGVNLKEDKSVGLRLESSMLKQLEGLDFINISLGQVEVTLNANDLSKDFEDRDVIQMEIKPKRNENQESYGILFMDENGNNIPKLENNIMINIPINEKNPEYSTVFFNDGKEIQQIGGQYDPITNTMGFGTKLAGEYYIVKNHKQYEDISHLNQDIQDAINFMTSKGFIEGRDDKNFDPDVEITRAEFTSFLVNTFYVLDKTLNTNFADVTKDNWYYYHIASSEKEGIINGFPDGTFKSEDVINKEQIVAIAARALHEKKKYLYPENIEVYLSFIDNEDIGDWAKKDVALAYRETLIDMPDNRYFEPQKAMTRADATEIIYRLFQLLYETSPSELGGVETMSNDVPIFPIVGGSGLVGIGVGGWYYFRRKRFEGR